MHANATSFHALTILFNAESEISYTIGIDHSVAFQLNLVSANGIEQTMTSNKQNRHYIGDGINRYKHRLASKGGVRLLFCSSSRMAMGY